MGGAERNARKRKQKQTEAARAVAAARGTSSDRTKVIIGLLVVVVLAAAVVAGVLYQKGQADKQAAAPIAVTTVNANYPVSLASGGVVVAGKDTAKVTIDAYEDFICPACGAFFQQSDTQMEQALEQGKLKVRYHMMNFLDANSNPPGYSLRAANASLCAADGGQFPNYYTTLYKAQPQEGSAGYSDNQLVQLGKDLKAGGDFEGCVRNGRHTDAVKADFAQAQQDLPPKLGGSFATPTVLFNGQPVQAMGNPNWLNDLLSRNS